MSYNCNQDAVRRTRSEPNHRLLLGLGIGVVLTLLMVAGSDEPPMPEAKAEPTLPLKVDDTLVDSSVPTKTVAEKAIDKASEGETLSSHERNEVLATAINLSGYLCARVKDAYAIGNGKVYVTCQEYRRSPASRVKYTIDPNTMIVEPR